MAAAQYLPHEAEKTLPKNTLETNSCWLMLYLSLPTL